MIALNIAKMAEISNQRRALESAGFKVFSSAELREHDISVRKDARLEAKQDLLTAAKNYENEVNKNAAKVLEDEWHERERLFMDPDRAEFFMRTMILCSNLSLEILIRDFGWTAPGEASRPNATNAVKFGNLFFDELERISSSEFLDIRRENERIEKTYGICLKRVEFDDEVEE